jgi:GDP-L-fucose synthase
MKTHQEVDLANQKQVREFFLEYSPDYVFLAAAKVGGIYANWKYPAEFIYQNLMISTNVIHESFIAGVKKLLNLGSSCIYPKLAEQPMSESSLLTGTLEPTNEPYAIAKIAGIKLCDSYRRQYDSDFISAMPTNIYGPNDNFDLETSHVLAALIRKIHEAKTNSADSVTIWGTGKPRREFLHVDDAADALVFLMENFSGAGPINVGVGEDISILTLAELISKIIGFEGRIEFDLSKPDGTPQKLLDISRITKLGWKPKVTLEKGIRLTYDWYLSNL